MKHAPREYAAAFSDCAAPKLSPTEERQLVARFLALIERNGDFYAIEKIVVETEKMLREKTGRRSVVLETARALVPTMQKTLRGLFKAEDVVRETVNPDLIAGVRITMNDTEQFDGSLKRKIQKLFS